MATLPGLLLALPLILTTLPTLSGCSHPAAGLRIAPVEHPTLAYSLSDRGGEIAQRPYRRWKERKNWCRIALRRMGMKRMYVQEMKASGNITAPKNVHADHTELVRIKSDTCIQLI